MPQDAFPYESLINSIAQERLNELKPVTDRNERLRDAAERFSADKKVSDTLTAAANRMEAGEEQENLKERRRISLRKIRGNEFVYEYDAFLPMAFNSMFQQNGEYHDEIRNLVRGAEEGEYYGKDGSERFLKELKSIVDSIPEEKRPALLASLSLDPRPGYLTGRSDPYGFPYAGKDVRFCVEDGVVKVFDVVDEP